MARTSVTLEIAQPLRHARRLGAHQLLCRGIEAR